MNAAIARLTRLGSVVCLMAALATVGCNGSAMMPTAPSQNHDAVVPQLPPAGPVQAPSVLRGRVTEAAPTSVMEIYPAVVTIVDGEYAGKSAETDAGGFYQINGLRPGTFTVSVSAEGFVSTSERVEFGVEQTANFALLPIPQTLRYELTGDMRATDVACSDGRPCQIIQFPIHNSGTVVARLDWTPSASSDLDLALYLRGSNQPIAVSAKQGRENEVVRADLQGGQTYELRVTYARGTSPARYTVTLDCPN